MIGPIVTCFAMFNVQLMHIAYVLTIHIYVAFLYWAICTKSILMFVRYEGVALVFRIFVLP